MTKNDTFLFADIEKALELGGYAEDMLFTGINGSETVMAGFVRGKVPGIAGDMVEKVENGDIKQIILIGGCDGAKPGKYDSSNWSRILLLRYNTQVTPNG